jgi:hypothetical protein
MFKGITTLLNLVNDLQSTAHEVASTALVERGAGWIRELKKDFPYAYNLLMAGLYERPEVVLEQLILMNVELRELRGNRFVLDYISRIQAYMRQGGKKP